MNSFWSFGVSGLSLFIGLLLFGVLCFFTVVQWRRGRWAKRLLLVESLRLLVAALLIFTLFRPEKVVRERVEGHPMVAILSDQSGSMETRDVLLEAGTTQSRREWLDARHAADVWSPLAEQFTILNEGFSAAPADPELAEKTGTDINAALEAIEKGHDNLRAVVLLTDGDWNQGASPVGAATRLRMRDVPVFAITVGRDRYLPDVELVSVSAPAYGLLNEQISIPFTLQSRMTHDVSVEVLMAGPDGMEDRKTLSIPAMSQLQDSMVLQPKYEGDFNYFIQVEPVVGELIKSNNRIDFQMNLRREILKVLVIESSPRWEFRYLNNALQRDPGVIVKCLLLHPELGVGGGRNYLNAFPKDKEELSTYDVVFIGDVGIGQGQLTREQCDLLVGLVEQQGSGLVFLPGIRGLQASLADHPIAELNPVIMDGDHPEGHGFVNTSRLVLTSRGRDHLLSLLAGSAQENQSVWKNLPGFYWHAPVLRARAGSTVLAVHGSARTEQGRVPLLATRNCGNGKSLFLGTDGAWRWRRGVEDTYHYRFWGQVVRWMSHQRHLAHKEGIRFFFNPETPRRGDQVFLHTTVFDRSGFPVETGPVQAIITGPDQSTESLELNPEDGGWGVFTGSFTPRLGGTYQIKMICTSAEREVDASLFVASPSLEVIGRPARRQVLKEIAEITHGRVAKMGELEDVVQSISILPERQPVETRFRLWSHPLWAGLIALLLAVYWSSRKWLGYI
jgi:hypothetical protein